MDWLRTFVFGKGQASGATNDTFPTIVTIDGHWTVLNEQDSSSNRVIIESNKPLAFTRIQKKKQKKKANMSGIVTIDGHWAVIVNNNNNSSSSIESTEIIGNPPERQLNTTNAQRNVHPNKAQRCRKRKEYRDRQYLYQKQIKPMSSNQNDLLAIQTKQYNVHLCRLS